MPSATVRPTLKATERPDQDPSSAWGAFDDFRASYITLRRLLGGIVEPFGLVVSDYSALKLASHGPTRPSAVSQRLGISPAATTELLDRLEERGLLRRDRDPTDRRATVVVLTPTGTKLCEEAGGAYRRFLARIAGEMSTRGLASLQAGTRELREVLEAHLAELDREGRS